MHFMPLSCERIGNAYSGRLDSWRFRIREGVVKRGFPNFQPGGGFPDVQALGEQGASAFKFAGRDDRSSRAAAASPAIVRSLTRSRSKAARAPKTWKISRPPGVVVSILGSVHDLVETAR